MPLCLHILILAIASFDSGIYSTSYHGVALVYEEFLNNFTIPGIFAKQISFVLKSTFAQGARFSK